MPLTEQQLTLVRDAEYHINRILMHLEQQTGRPVIGIDIRETDISAMQDRPGSHSITTVQVELEGAPDREWVTE